ncbi:hypothetical protein PG994_002892 [Apiospora phragmitis]|uniref:CFEM domain-containing protein n=1 Tax=Apiospora phragmitis TaxID=2905665 RepID=A0ABR1W9D7_9PEZI
MKYSFTAATLLAVVAAQSMSDIPSCAVPCIQSAAATSTSCTATDYKCICNDVDAIQGAASSCVLEKCGATVAMSAVVPAVKSFCEKVAAAPAAAPAMSQAADAAPAPAAESTPCTDEVMPTTAPAPMSSAAAVMTESTTPVVAVPTSAPEAVSMSSPYAESSTPEAVSMSSPYAESSAAAVASSSVCESESESETSTMAGAMATGAASSTAAAIAATGAYGTAPTTSIVQAGGSNYSTATPLSPYRHRWCFRGRGFRRHLGRSCSSCPCHLEFSSLLFARLFNHLLRLPLATDTISSTINAMLMMTVSQA